MPRYGLEQRADLADDLYFARSLGPHADSDLQDLALDVGHRPALLRHDGRRQQHVSEVETEIEAVPSTPLRQPLSGSPDVPLGGADLEPIYRQVKWPATGLLIIGIISVATTLP